MTTTSGSTVTSTEKPSGKPLSGSSLVTQADAICRRLNNELDTNKGIISSQQDIARVALHRAAIEQTALTELSKLTPPAAMAHDYQHLLAARQTVIEDIKKIGEDAAVNNTNSEAPLYVSSAALVRQMAATAQRNGFKYCGQLG